MSDDRAANDRAYVFKDGRLAASIARTESGTAFAYVRDYLDDGCIPLASTLPLTDEPVLRPGRSVPPYFAGLLPEGRRLTALRRTLKVSADDELGMLVAVGGDPAGDVAISSSVDPPRAAHTGPKRDGTWQNLRFSELLAEHGIVDPTTLAGVQDKVSGRMITVPLRYEGRAHLLKLTPPDLPRLVENEAFFLGHAARLLVPTVEWELVDDRDGIPGLLVTRFDRVQAGDTLLSLPVEDGAQLMGLYPADKYSVTTEELTRAVSRACTSVPLALRAVFIQVVWAWLTGNGDLHAKNISVVGRSTTAAGTRRPEVVVAPVYDIPSTWPYGDHTLALPVHGRRDGITRRRLMEFATAIGLPERAAARALDETTRVAAGMIDDVRAGGSPWRGKARNDLVAGLAYRLEQAA